jgi:hypothetical protein
MKPQKFFIIFFTNLYFSKLGINKNNLDLIYFKKNYYTIPKADHSIKISIISIIICFIYKIPHQKSLIQWIFIMFFMVVYNLFNIYIRYINNDYKDQDISINLKENKPNPHWILGFYFLKIILRITIYFLNYYLFINYITFSNILWKYIIVLNMVIFDCFFIFYIYFYKNKLFLINLVLNQLAPLPYKDKNAQFHKSIPFLNFTSLYPLLETIKNDGYSIVTESNCSKLIIDY